MTFQLPLFHLQLGEEVLPSHDTFRTTQYLPGIRARAAIRARYISFWPRSKYSAMPFAPPR